MDIRSDIFFKKKVAEPKPEPGPKPVTEPKPGKELGPDPKPVTEPGPKPVTELGPKPEPVTEPKPGPSSGGLCEADAYIVSPVPDDDCGGDRDSACSINISELREQNFEYRCDSDFFAINLEAGGIYEIAKSDAGRAYLYNSEGELLISDWTSRNNYIPEERGRYYIEMKHQPEKTSTEEPESYSFRINKDDCSFRAPCLLTVGTPLEVSLDSLSLDPSKRARDDDSFCFTLEAGKNYKIQINPILDSLERKAYMMTLDTVPDDCVASSSGEEDLKAFTNISLSDKIFFSPSATGKYLLTSIAFHAGEVLLYSVSVDVVPTGDEEDDCAGGSSTSCSLTVGTENKALFEKTGDTDWFSVTLEAGKFYQVSAALGNYIFSSRNSDEFSLKGKIYNSSEVEQAAFGFGDVGGSPQLRQAFVPDTAGGVLYRNSPSFRRSNELWNRALGR